MLKSNGRDRKLVRMYSIAFTLVNDVSLYICPVACVFISTNIKFDFI